MTPQEQIKAMKTKLSKLINQKSQIVIDIRRVGEVISQLETIAKSASNPNLAADLVKPFEETDDS